MSFAWIKIRKELSSSPKVVQMAVRFVSASEADIRPLCFQVVGALLAVWSVFDSHSIDGRLDGYTGETIDHMIGWPGFAAAMVAVQWLEIGDGFIRIPRYDVHLSRSAKRRALDAERKKNVRIVSAFNADMDADAQRKKTGPEKRRETLSNTDVLERERAPKATRLKATWSPPPEYLEDVQRIHPKWTAEQRDRCVEMFRNHWIAQPGQRGVKTDWRATWRNWLHREGDAPGRVNGAAGPAWWESEATIKAKGAELGLHPRAGEELKDFKGRIQAALDSQK